MTEHYIYSFSCPSEGNIDNNDDIAAILKSKQEKLKNHPDFSAFGPFKFENSDPYPFVSHYKTKYPRLKYLERYEGRLFDMLIYCFHIVYLE
jgi:hypothetical protein